MIWHSESVSAILTQLGTNQKLGLSSDTAAKRLRDTGKNVLHTNTKAPFFRRLGARFKRPSVLAMLALSLVALGVNVYAVLKYRKVDWITPSAIMVLTLLRCLLDTWQDRHAGVQPRSLGLLRAPITHVRRDGVQIDLTAAELVPGDILDLTAGDAVPADCRLLDSYELRCDESLLTGDFLPVPKDASAHITAITPLAERANMLYAGSAVLRGSAHAVVVQTGNHTVLAGQTHTEKGTVSYPQHDVLKKSGHTLSFLALVAGVAATLIAVFSDLPLLSALLLGAALAVALSPEELASCAPAVWVAAMRRLAKRGAIVSGCETMETLGRVNVLMADKTGFFTKNDTSLRRAFAGDRMVKMDKNRTPEDLHTLLQLALLCDDGESNAAVADYLEHHRVDTADLIAAYPGVEAIPADITRHRTLSIHLIEGQYVVIVKGAPEEVLPLCHDLPESVSSAEEFLNAEALRTLAVACKTIPAVPSPLVADELEENLSFVGLLGFLDPPQEDAAAAVSECFAAGVHPMLLANDSLAAAVSTARRIGLFFDSAMALSGDDLATLTDEELQDLLPNICVCARLSPQDKLRLVNAWKARGAVVAVTGSNADDTPAMHAADIGCAAPSGGASVTATADLIVTDVRFAALVDAIRAGRTAYSNLRRTVAFRLASGIATVIFVLAALIGLGVSPIYLPALLWTSLVSATLPVIALAHEPAPRDNMRRPHRSSYEGAFGNTPAAVALGVLFGAATVAAWMLGNVTAAVAVWILGLTLMLFTCRSAQPFGRSRLLHAPWTILLGLLAAALTLPLLFVPALQELCGLAVESGMWQLVLSLLAIIVVICEVAKWIMVAIRRR